MQSAFAQQPMVTEDIAELETLKKRFAAELLLNPNEPYKAAQTVFGLDTGRALFASNFWPKDDFVRDEMERLLKEHGAAHFLPSKVDIAREIITVARAGKTASEQFAGYRLYADIMGMMPEKSNNGGNTSVLVAGAQKVMVVSSQGSDDDWAKRAANNQALLLEQAAEDLAQPD